MVCRHRMPTTQLTPLLPPLLLSPSPRGLSAIPVSPSFLSQPGAPLLPPAESDPPTLSASFSVLAHSTPNSNPARAAPRPPVPVCLYSGGTGQTAT